MKGIFILTKFVLKTIWLQDILIAENVLNAEGKTRERQQPNLEEE
jgi:hypothetical protein